MSQTMYERAFNVFAQFPEGLTVREFEALMDTPNEIRSASARLSQFVTEQLAKKVGGDGLSRYVPTGREFADRVLPQRDKSRGRKAPTNAELIELRRFKAEALRRCPELAVPEHVLAARRQVMAFFKARGETSNAALAGAGDLDHLEITRFAIWMAEGKGQ